MSTKPSNTMAIIGLIIGLIALIFSFIKCVGTIAFVPGLVGVILGVLSWLKARDEGHPQGLSLGVIAVSVIACAISAYQIYSFQSMASKVKGEMKEYTTCEEVIADYEKTQKELVVMTKKMEEEDVSPLAGIGDITKLGFKLSHIQESSDRLGCDINIEDFDVEEVILDETEGGSGEEEGEQEGEGETEGEAESIESEQGN